MTSTTLGITNYYSAFISPLKSYEVDSTANLIYGAMANKIYTQNVSKKVQSSVSSYLSSLNLISSDMKATSKQLISKGPDSSFNQKTVSSTDGAAVKGTADSNAAIKTYNINIAKLAKSQVNEGSKLQSDAPSSFSEGINAFKLKVGNKETNVSFSINQNDTNKSGLQKIAKAINSVKAGVTASVYSDSKTGASYLKLSAEKTGTDNQFSMQDTTGNAVSASGMGSVSVQSQNAEYMLDGQKYTSQSNTISLDNDKVRLTLNKANSKDIKLTTGVDNAAVKSDITDFVDSYNSAISYANTSSSSFAGASKLADELSSITKSRASSLSSIGINRNEDGTLSVDSDKLDKSISQDISKVKDIFSGYSGVAQKVFDKGNDILYSPMKYARPAEQSGNNSLFNSISSNRSYAYSRNMYAGMIVDTLL